VSISLFGKLLFEFILLIDERLEDKTFILYSLDFVDVVGLDEELNADVCYVDKECLIFMFFIFLCGFEEINWFEEFKFSTKFA